MSSTAVLGKLHIPSTIKSMPSEWLWHRLDDICLMIVDCPHSTPKITDSGPLMVRTQDILSGSFRTEAAAHVSIETYLERTRRAIPSIGDLLYSREGTYFGIAAEVPPNVQVCLGQRMVLIKPDPNQIHFRFLRYWLNSYLLTAHVYGQRDGTVAERLNLPTIRGLPIPLPTLPEQRSIANILSALDDKIELNRQTNMTLDAITRAIFKSWFEDFDPVRHKMEGRESYSLDSEMEALFPNSFIDSFFGAIPKTWEIVELGMIVDVIDCLHTKKPLRQPSGKPLLQLWNIREDGLIDMTDTFWINEENYKLWTSRIEANFGDCVITNVGRVGAVSQIPMGLRAALGRNMTGLRCKPSYLYPTFLIQCLISTTMAQEITLKIDNGTILDALNVRNIPKLRLILPPKPILELFEKKCRPLREKMEHNIKENETLRTVRDTLLPKLLSGEIRIKEAEKYAEALL